MLRKSGLAITLTSSSATSASTGQSSGDARVRAAVRAVTPDRGSRSAATAVSVLAVLARDDLEDVVDRDVVVRPLVDLAAVAQHDDPVAEAQHLLEFGGDEHDRHAVGGEVGDELLDLGLGADVDAAGGLVEDEQLAAR